MKKVLKWLDDNAELSILITLLAAIVVIMLYQIVRRYVFNSSLSWSEEFCRYCFICFVFIGTSYSIKLDTELRVDAVLSALPAKVRKAIEFFNMILALVLVSWLFYESFGTVAYIKSTNDISTGLHLPMWILYISMVVGFGMSVFRSIQRLIRKCKKSNNGEEAKK